MLARRGYTSEYVENGAKAVAAAATRPFDLILMVCCPLSDPILGRRMVGPNLVSPAQAGSTGDSDSDLASSKTRHGKGSLWRLHSRSREWA